MKPEVDFEKVSYSSSIKEAVFWFVFWIVLSAMSVLFPYGLGAIIPVAGIIVSIDDIEHTTTGPAIAGAFVTMLLAAAIGDPFWVFYLLAAIGGIASLAG